MPKLEEGLQSQENQWGIVKFFTFFSSIWSSLKSTFNYFSSTKMDYLPGKAGELMRSHMENKNIYDKITSWWSEQSAWKKATYIVGFTLSAGLAGLFIGAPTLLALSAAFLSFLGHGLFKSNENSRKVRATALVEQTLALEEDARVRAAFFNEAAQELTAMTTEVKPLIEELSEQAASLRIEVKAAEEATDVIVTITNQAKVATDNLITQERAAAEHFEAVAVDLEALDSAIEQTTIKVGGIGAAVSQFSEVVHDVEESGKEFKAAVSRFSLFVDEKMRAKSPVMDFDETDAFIERARKANDEDDEFLAQLDMVMASL